MGRGNWIAILVLGIVALGGVIAVRWRPTSPAQLISAPVPSAGTPSPAAARGDLPGVAPSPGINELLRMTVIRSFKVAIEANHARFREMTATRWTQVMQGGDAGQRSMLSQKDVAEFRQSLRKLVQSVDDGLSVFAEAEAKGISLAGVADNALEANPEAWRIFRRFWAASERYYGILEENWEEYYEFGAQAPAEKARPWQKEAMQVEAEMNALKKELEELSAKSR